MKKAIINLINMLLLMLLYLYQNLISPFMSNSCRYYPSCSSFAKGVIEYLGPCGISLIFKRVLRCNPFCEGGYDPVPTMIKKKKKYE